MSSLIDAALHMSGRWTGTCTSSSTDEDVGTDEPLCWALSIHRPQGLNQQTPTVFGGSADYDVGGGGAPLVSTLRGSWQPEQELVTIHQVKETAASSGQRSHMSYNCTATSSVSCWHVRSLA